ncbi:hypothetical protein ACWGNE_13245 [Streptomyces xiamenensis]|uniref:hypothetical protein n=1 Tax=Streptomyces xiamenensis TaxID=408015 RepID=UPI00369D6FC5
MVRKRYLVPLVAVPVLLIAGWIVLSREQAYEVAEDLCGMHVAPELTASLLPAGEQLEVRNPHVNSSADLLCRIDIDGATALAIDVFHFGTASQSLREWYERTPEGSWGFVGGEEGRVGDDDIIFASSGSLIRTECADDRPEAVLDINVQIYSPTQETEEGRRAMKDFTAALMAAAKENYAC